MIPLRVEEKQGDWNAETKTNAQKTNADGVPMADPDLVPANRW